MEQAWEAIKRGYFDLYSPYSGLLGKVPVALQAARAPARTGPAKQVNIESADGQTARALQLLRAAHALSRKAAGKPLAKDIVRRNKYVLALLVAHRKARGARTS